uniref:Uncharacterized protein n=1 Tax=Rhizophora mucronata TaxID=61149 RepID=A0A2P2NCI1_RHIMU
MFLDTFAGEVGHTNSQPFSKVKRSTQDGY